MATAVPTESVQCFGRKKTAVAVTHCKRGRGLIKINGSPIELVEPEILRFKAYEPILLLGRHRFAGVDMRIRVKGGGHPSQIYAIRQSIAKALVAFYQKYVDEQSKKEIKDILVRYDRTLLVADPRRCETKKFGGRGARARISVRFFPVNENELFSVAFKVFAGMLGLEPERWRERNGLGQSLLMGSEHGPSTSGSSIELISSSRSYRKSEDFYSILLFPDDTFPETLLGANFMKILYAVCMARVIWGLLLRWYFMLIRMLRDIDESQTDDRRVGGQNWTDALCYL
ncbi:hypothetical protein POTOM_005913 [Populus tomentosa]|uniref:40S ribosomal protein S16 n=1 Tax=Populus tomentosa TaxID=118781 RepID=A0A8X8DE99_POPTO|nr:hypothetical protein POTOM_005913 [Populus tomentosa]